MSSSASDKQSPQIDKEILLEVSVMIIFYSNAFFRHYSIQSSKFFPSNFLFFHSNSVIFSQKLPFFQWNPPFFGQKLKFFFQFRSNFAFSGWNSAILPMKFYLFRSNLAIFPCFCFRTLPTFPLFSIAHAQPNPWFSKNSYILHEICKKKTSED